MKKLFISLGVLISMALIFIGSIIWSDKSLQVGLIISTLDIIFPQPEYKLPQYSEEELDVLFEGIEPYTGELPQMPDKKLNNSTLLGIDSNNNGVRDDLEIWIVEHFGRDKMVVESFFAYVRSNARDKVIQRDGLFTDELYENEISGRTSKANECRSNYYYDSGYPTSDIDLYLISTNFMKIVDNTQLRKQIEKDFYRQLSGHIYSSISLGEEECLQFFEETKLYKIY